MKFSDGQWNNREEFNLNFAAQVYDFEVQEKKLILYMPVRSIKHRGDTLNTPMITVEVSFALEGIIRIKAYHHIGHVEALPAHNLKIEYLPFFINNEEDYIIVKNGDISAKIKKNDGYQIEFFNNEKLITKSERNSLSYITDTSKKSYMREQLSIDVSELIYGLGERFTPFVRNGQSVDIWQNDGGTGSEQSYKNIPFYISNKGYGVFVNHLENVSYEVASEKVTKAQFSVEGEVLDYFIITGPSMKEVLMRYAKLTGLPTLPPAWSFGLWLSTSFTTNYDEATVMSFIDGMLSRDIPLDVFHFDCFWMKGFEWCNFIWDINLFKDPKAMLARIKAKGLKICLWINPYIGQKSPMFAEGMQKGYLLKRADGSTWQADFWQAGLAIVDFTNPEAVKWYNSKLEALLDMGVDCFKTDFGERIPTDVVYHNNASPHKMHNYYAYLYNEVVFDLLKRKKGEKEAVLFARSAAAGSQKFPVHWGGDSWSNYPSMAESLRGGLSFTLSGFSYWSHDISGFEQGASEDLYKRWTQFGLLSSHSRYHGSTEYKVPWNYGDEAVEITRKFTKLKNKLMPYLYCEAAESSSSGVPMMRAMVLDFTDDETCHYLDRQYMLGQSLLISPIFNSEGLAKYYLPNGIWTNFLTNEVKKGAAWYSEYHDYHTLPFMVKENSIVVLGEKDNLAAYDYAVKPTFHIFELSQAHAYIYDINANKVAKINGKKENDIIKFDVEGVSGVFYILLRNIFNIKSVDGGKADADALGTVITCMDVKDISIYL